MVQHYFASAWLIDKSDGAQAVPRDFFTGKSDIDQPRDRPAWRMSTRVGMFVPLGEIAPSTTKTFDATTRSSSARRRKTNSRRWRRASNW